MYAKTLGVIGLFAALSGAPVFAQDHTINGQPVPSDQMEEIQAKCDELRAAGGDAAAGAAAGAPAENPSAPAAAPSAAPAPAAPAAGAAPAENPSAGAPVEAQIDVETLTAEMCEAGGFASSTP